MRSQLTVGDATPTSEGELPVDFSGTHRARGRTARGWSAVLLALLIAATPVSGQSVGGFYLGTLSRAGRTLDVGLDLTATDGAVSGSYFYFGPAQESLALAGTLDAAGSLQLTESRQDGTATGYWTGRHAGAEFTGSWTDAKKLRRWEFRLLRSDLASSYFEGTPRTLDAGRNGTVSYRMAKVPGTDHRIPLLTAFRDPRVVSLINGTLMTMANAARCVEPPDDTAFEAELLYIADDVLGVNIEHSWFCGAAHPSAGSDAVVVDLRTARPVGWDDLFRKDATPEQVMLLLFPYEAWFSTLTHADSENTAQEGCQEHWTPGQLVRWGVGNSFQLSAEGLRVQLDIAHAMGHCRNRVTVPYAALATVAAPEGILARLAAPHAGKPLRYRIERPLVPAGKALFYTPPPK